VCDSVCVYVRSVDVSVLLQTSSLPLSTVDPNPSSPPLNHITVAMRQPWAWQGTAAPPISLASSHAPTTQDATGPVRRQQLAHETQKEQCVDRRCISLAWEVPSTSSAPLSPVLLQASQPAGGSSDAPPSSVSTKLSGQRAYLQSLDRSSRAWVLSSGKTQASDETCGLQPESGSNIWYNPIPEEEDPGGPRREEGDPRGPHREEEHPRGPCREEQHPRGPCKEEQHPRGPCREEGDPRGPGREIEVWRRRDDREEGGADCRAEDANPSISHFADDITAETTDPAHSDSSPASQKKGGVSGSVMDRLRSPGTVRKLSLKMKKLPELRRKLSLRSSSRAHRQGNDSRVGADESTSKNASSSSSSSALSNQNVISRYHLDSTAPPARPRRRSSRGRSAKGGYLSDGDSPELLPRQQAPPSTTSPETFCDVSSFRLYAGCDLSRCSQRVTGLLTVHLLGLEEMKSSRSEDSKEVFLAIQIDGVTRARTALLSLRGSTLPLNHAFNLELERARLLRIVVLTP
ncbi:rho GTPase-activating protein SYDE2-like, partial [Plectropomus leopardus]|uniref:rho GTPase-activating protein SYDE2-like n=1 Tax=Plectropomus leopardus TaxID=160734 RepID=UPI001C4C0B93